MRGRRPDLDVVVEEETDGAGVGPHGAQRRVQVQLPGQRRIVKFFRRNFYSSQIAFTLKNMASPKTFKLLNLLTI